MGSKSLVKSAGGTVAAYIFEAFAWLLPHLGARTRRHVVGLIALVSRLILPDMISALKLNLQRLLGLNGAALDRTANEAFRNFVFTLHDFFFPETITIDVPDRGRIEALRREHGGLLVLTFHMGHWELGARTMQTWGWPVTAVYQPYQNARFKQVIESRRAPGVNYLAVGERAAVGVRAALRRGDVVAMLGDHPFGEDGSPVELMGHRVMWPKGPVLLAVREGTPIVVAVIVRTAPGRYRAIIEDALVPENRTRSEVERLVQAVATKFGKLLTRYPTQWYRFRPFDFLPPESQAAGFLSKSVSSEQR